MVFCGQCGLHLPAGTTRCPRCGAVSDTTSNDGVDTFSTDAPTVASLTYAQPPQVDIHSNTPRTSVPFTPREQQKLILHGSDFATEVPGENEPTSEMNATDYRTQQKPMHSQTSLPYQNVPPSGGYPPHTGNEFQNGGYTPASYGHRENGSYGRAVPNSSPFPQPTPQKKRRTLPLFFALLVLLIVLGVSTFFVVKRFHLLSTSGGTNGGITTPAGPIEQAKGVVTQYYTAINNKSYQEAYGLWKWGANAPSFATFANGYANTEHDTLTIRNATQQADGTVKVALTIVATERISGGTQQHTYIGYYIVGQDAGTWKIFRGVLNRI